MNQVIVLSPEDLLWVEAIAQRAKLTKYTAYYEPYPYCYRQATYEVEQFYYLQLVYYGWVEREPEAQLRAKRLAYEAETERLEQERIEADIEAKRQWRERRDKRIAIAKELQFETAEDRDKWIHQERRAGRSIGNIAKQIGYAWTTLNNIAGAENHKARNRYRDRMETLKRRPLDMGGPRDVWLTYYPSPDPRLDNMEPVV